MIILIDEKNDTELLTQYADLSDAPEGFDKLPDDKRANLRTALVQAQSIEPTFSEDNTRATFTFPSSYPLIFKKSEDGRWLLKN